MQAKQLEGHSLQALLVLAAIESRKDRKRGHQCFCLAKAPSLPQSHRDCCTAWANPATSLHRRVQGLGFRVSARYSLQPPMSNNTLYDVVDYCILLQYALQYELLVLDCLP